MGQTMRNSLGLVLAFGAIAFGGQSIQLSTQTVSNGLIPAQTPGKPWRVEFSIHDWNSNPSAGNPLQGAAVGAIIQFLNGGGGDVRLQVYSNSTTGGSVCQIPGLGPGGPAGGGSVYTNRFITVRFQEDPVALIDYCQAWDINGNMVWNDTHPYTSNTGTNMPGAMVGSTGQNLSTAYFRIYSCTVSTGARPPVTADTMACALVFWKFDGNLNDSSGNGYNAQISSGTAAFVSTPGQNLVVSVLQTPSAPAWSNTVSLRAGFPNQLNGAASYSQADGSANVQCFWQVLSGPSPVIWDSHGSCTPTVRGLIWGDYAFQLLVTDVNNNQATTMQDIGAVATDSNGVVVNANPVVDILLGNQIAWGRNPWGYQDYWTAHAVSLRNGDYAATVTSQGQTYPGWTTNGGKPQWETPGQGTVSYYFNGVGSIYYLNGNLGTTLNGSITPTSASIAVTAASGLDLTNFPTRIIVYDGTNWDELRVCSASGNALNLCYDPSALPRHSFANGVNVIQSKVTGSGTLFLTDPNSAVCPVGAPGLPGLATYSTGTVSMSAGSATMTGSGTTWTTANGVIVGDFVQVSATHSGTPFTFMASISSVNSTTGITLARPFPSDADTNSGLSYAVMPATRTIALHYKNLYTDPMYDSAGDSMLMFGTTGCESETSVYTIPIAPGLGNSFSSGHDILGLDGTLQAGKLYSISDTTGWVNQSSTGGINFYGEDVASWALAIRSGLNVAKTAAQSISNYWAHSPWGNPDGNGNPRLFLGGGAIGAWISYLADPSTLVKISTLRGYASLGVGMVNGFAANGCNAWDDTRDSGYAYTWLILAAIYDPDTISSAAPGGISWRAYWQSFLRQMQANDTACANQTGASNANYSWANGFVWNGTSAPALTMTNGSATATGTGIPSSLCNGVASGTASVTNGSNLFAVLSGSLPGGANGDVFLTGTTGGGASVFVQSLAYSNSGSAGTLGGYWLGDTGTVTWIAGNWDGYPGNGIPQSAMTIATSNNDLADLQKQWACTWNSSTSITLNRPWDGPSTDGTHVYHPYVANTAGYGQQPFMLGIKSYGMNLLATQTLPALSSYVAPYATFTAGATSWIWNNGMDHQFFGTNYARIYQECRAGEHRAGRDEFHIPCARMHLRRKPGGRVSFN